MVFLALLVLLPATALADPPPSGGKPANRPAKLIDRPNLADYRRNQTRQSLLDAGKFAQARTASLSGTEKVLVILVEFGSDTITWHSGDHWDPVGKADSSEWAGTVGDCSKIITQTTTFTYDGPRHNQIPRPLSANLPYSTTLWTSDFNSQWFNNLIFGNGMAFNYSRQDGSPVFADLTGKSVRNYYSDISNGAYTIAGDLIDWVQLPHSAAWYGADECPGYYATPSIYNVQMAGAIPNAGNLEYFLKDTIDAVNASHPEFNWSQYDQNGDGIVDRLWITHAGYGEEEDPMLLNGMSYGTGVYGEHALWSQSTQLSAPYPAGGGISVGPFILMAENSGISIFAHEYGHSLGAIDLYAQSSGRASAGFWTLMGDDQTGFPIGAVPPAPDPLHLDLWGWLSPYMITEPGQVYEVTLGQASQTPTTSGSIYRGIKIQLPTRQVNLAVAPWQGSSYWWGGNANAANSRMTLQSPIPLPGGAGSAQLYFDLAYDLEDQWDYLWVQASTNGGSSWTTLTNTNTQCSHDSQWIGAYYGFPTDLCTAHSGGFTGKNSGWPTPQTQTFDLASYRGSNIQLRFWYMTDWATTKSGPFIDNVKVTAGSTTLFSDNGESGDANWNYEDAWVRSHGTRALTQSYYLQWRNVGQNGGYDYSALGDSRWRYGPATTGMLVWYNNNAYNDNEISGYVQDAPSFGPKGKMLVVDSHPEPYRDPVRVLNYPNSISNLSSRMQMRDAPFNLTGTPSFTYPFLDDSTRVASYAGRSAISLFDDSQGYYPGVEYALRGKAPCSTYAWFDKQWDAGVVLPAAGPYSTKATGGSGFSTSTQIGIQGYVNANSSCQAAWSGPWYVPFADSANSGNSASGAYGWHVQVLSQSSDGKSATIRIWNSRSLYLPLLSR